MGINSSNYSAVQLESPTAFSCCEPQTSECVEPLIQVSLLKDAKGNVCQPRPLFLLRHASMEDTRKTTISIKTQLPLINAATGRLKQFVPKMSIITP